VRRGGVRGRDLLQQFGDRFGGERLAQAEIGLRTRRRGQADHELARAVQPQPAHRPVHAVHVDDDMGGVLLGHQRPAPASAHAGFGEGGFQGRFSGGVHAGEAEGRKHVRDQSWIYDRGASVARRLGAVNAP
jgi:hypothetical protein